MDASQHQVYILFSSAGDVCSEKCTFISSENIERLLFTESKWKSCCYSVWWQLWDCDFISLCIKTTECCHIYSCLIHIRPKIKTFLEFNDGWKIGHCCCYVSHHLSAQTSSVVFTCARCQRVDSVSGCALCTRRELRRRNRKCIRRKRSSGVRPSCCRHVQLPSWRSRYDWPVLMLILMQLLMMMIMTMMTSRLKLMWWSNSFDFISTERMCKKRLWPISCKHQWVKLTNYAIF